MSPDGTPIFLHSTWRTGSTYLWAKFRARADTCCYFEPLNEHLADATPAFIDAFAPWSYANHPTLQAPYLEEFRPLLEHGGGIKDFPAALAYGHYRLDSDIERPDLRAYLDRLERHARDLGRTPVFGCVRTSLRVGWFKRHRPGCHIVIRRDPRRQFLSCLNQAVKGNRYFLERGMVILGGNREDRALAPLRDIVEVAPFDGPPPLRDDFYARRAWSTPWDTLYMISYFLHRLAGERLRATPVDLVVDMDRLSGERDSIAGTESDLKNLTGFEVCLADCAIERYDAHLVRFETQFTALEARVERLLQGALAVEAGEGRHRDP